MPKPIYNLGFPESQRFAEDQRASELYHKNLQIPPGGSLQAGVLSVTSQPAALDELLGIHEGQPWAHGLVPPPMYYNQPVAASFGTPLMDPESLQALLLKVEAFTESRPDLKSESEIISGVYKIKMGIAKESIWVLAQILKFLQA